MTTLGAPRRARAADNRARSLLTPRTRPASHGGADLAKVLGETNAAVTLLDRDWRVLFINERSASMVGSTREAMLGKKLWDLFPGAAVGTAYHAFQRAMREQVSTVVEQLSPNGGRRLHCLALPSPDGMLIITRDVEEPIGDVPANAALAPSPQPDVVEALRGTERRFRALIENSLDAVVLLNARGRVLYASPRVFGENGLFPNGVDDTHPLRLVHPDDAARLRDDALRLLAERDARVSGAYRVRQRDGRYIWIDGTAHNLLHDPDVRAIVINCRDVTERRRAEDDLRTSEQHFRLLIEGALDLVTVVDRSGAVLYASPSHERVLGWRPDELHGRSALELVHPDDRAALVHAFELSAAAGAASPLAEARVRHKDGSWRILESITHRTLEGSPFDGFIVNARDVSERHAAETRTTLLLDLARDLASTLDPMELLGRVGRRVAAALPCDLVGTVRRDPSGTRYVLHPHFGLPPEQLDAFVELPPETGQHVLERLSNGPVLRQDPRSADGLLGTVSRHMKITSAVAAPLRTSAGQHGALLAGSTRPDLRFDERHASLLEAIAGQVAVVLERAELARQRDEDARLFAALAAIGRNLLSELDPSQLPERLCRTAAEALGCEVGHTLEWLPEDHAYALAATHGVASEVVEALRVLRIPRDVVEDVLSAPGTEDVVQLVAGGETTGAALASCLGVPRGCRVLVVALRRGAELIGIQTAVRSVPGEGFDPVSLQIAGGLAHLASLALEHARAMEELSRANRLKSDFVAMISHELRTPLNVILGYSDLLLDDTFGQLTAEQADTMRIIHARGHELLELIREVLDLSRLESGRIPLDLKDVELHEVITAVEESARPLERPGEVELVVDVTPDLGTLLTDPAKLSVVLKNLLANAFKFTTAGRVALRVRRDTAGVAFTVEDTGIGIPPEQLDIIFEPFRQGDPTLTRRHGGVGLGLHIVRRMVEMLGGTVRVESRPGTGSTFRVWLPVSGCAALPSPRPLLAGERPSSTDAVTGLPSAAVLRDRLAAAIRAGDPRHVAAAVLHVAIDCRPALASGLADGRRDALLCMVGERLASVLRMTDTVARAGGDDFVVLLPGRATDERVAELVQRVQATLDEELLLDGAPRRVHASVGSAVARGGRTSPDAVLSRARRAALRPAGARSGEPSSNG